MPTKEDELDFEIGNLPEGLNVSESSGAPEHLQTNSLELKQDIGKFGLAGKIWQSQIKVEPKNPIPEAYYRNHNNEHSSDDSKPFKVLELGAGTGYVGIALASQLKRPAQVYITDLEQVVPLINDNVLLHYSDHSSEKKETAAADIFVDRLHWGNKADAKRLLDKAGGSFDLVVVSDCVYFPELFGILIDTLITVCDAQTKVVIGYKCRSLEKEVGFWQDYFGRFFEYEPVRKVDLLEETVEVEEAGKKVTKKIQKEELGEFLGAEEQLFVFVGKKRPNNQVKAADDTFTTLLFCSMGL
ncbi:putative methyltransferase-domain-containing protein [Mycotypha africana]|uniref:putative methyltransferase-domain-containing protein n=1 Tax=Mycotypha africana TaxID=64632 RepID=UPI00230061F7|nr:putative methyltransferase-domain-containing protein [Mycotypha africana]KAI8984765.1 putative methyltransferase-domain-containing protein [Mycotypha africana]